ncbi:MAG: hypothetical protein NTW92_08755 [Bacteroidetes bacterium]|nr:hypothetical protein [Bacteroidota bacterium]
MPNQSNENYNIPMKYRKMENLHIVFWLFKDIAWCMFWKPLGIAMIIPTLSISIVIAYRTRDIFSELAHNIAITVWIMANSFWMCSEFFGVDNSIVFGNITVKHLAMIPFVTGILILGYYYLIYKPSHKEENLTL